MKFELKIVGHCLPFVYCVLDDISVYIGEFFFLSLPDSLNKLDLVYCDWYIFYFGALSLVKRYFLKHFFSVHTCPIFRWRAPMGRWESYFSIAAVGSLQFVCTAKICFKRRKNVNTDSNT